MKINDQKIDSLEDFDLALRKYKAGEAINVTVVRGMKDVTVKVILDAPR